MPPKCDGGPCGYVLCPGCDSSLDAFGSTSASCCLPILACLLTCLVMWAHAVLRKFEKPKIRRILRPNLSKLSSLGFPNNFTGLLHEVLLPQVWQKGEENWNVRSGWSISEMKSNMSTFETLVPSIIIVELQNFDSPTEVSTTSTWPQYPKATWHAVFPRRSFSPSGSSSTFFGFPVVAVAFWAVVLAIPPRPQVMCL